MKKELKITGLVISSIAVIILLFAWKNQSERKNGVNQKNYEIVQQWKLPKILEEISGISWIGDNRIACIQDEDGIIFIYDLKKSNIQQKVKFAGNGDYEDITIIDENAYVLRSDGKIFEVKDFKSGKSSVSEFKTFSSHDLNVEGLTHDKENKRLLIAVKEEDPDDKPYKGIYEFKLNQKKFNPEPVFKINLKDPLFNDIDTKLKKKMRPSAIGISPVDHLIYYLDGANPKLLIANGKGNLKKLYELDEGEFEQPEGITFNPKGELFISSEGNKNNPTILKVKFK